MLPHGVHSTSPAIHRINTATRERGALFLSVPYAERRAVWPRLSRHARHDIIAKLPDAEFVSLIEAIDPDQATDALQELPTKRQRELLRVVQSSIREQVEILLQFDPDTAAGMMSLDYIQVDDTETFARVSKRFKEHEKRTGRPAAILVLCSGVLFGTLPTYQLALRKAADPIRSYIRPIATINQGARRREIIHTFRDHPHDKVAVVNGHGSVLGIVYSDDVLRMLQEYPEVGLFSFAGVNATETITDAALTKVKRRYTWLIVNLGTGFLAAFTVSLFEATIAKFVLLAVYMPIVAGMGGNAATQTLAVLVRGIAQRHIDLPTALRTLKNEITAGALNGLLNGFIVAAVVVSMHKDLRLALVLSLAMSS